MGDWPPQSSKWGDHVSIAPWHPLSLGPGFKACILNSTPISTAWPAANRAILIPFRLPRMATAYQIVIGNGATAGGNFDVGIYDFYGNRIVSSGSIARSANSEVVANITDTQLGAGRYYLAVSVDGTNTISGWTLSNAYTPKFFGIRQASTAFVLPATVTFETVAAGVVPSLSVWLRPQ